MAPSLVSGLSGRTCRQLIAVTCSNGALPVKRASWKQIISHVEGLALAAHVAGLVLTLCIALLLPLLLMLLMLTAQVNSLTSFETDLPYEYYSMPFCKPVEGVHRAGNAANLGTVIMGIKLLNSQYNFTIMVRTSHAAATAAVAPCTATTVAVAEYTSASLATYGPVRPHICLQDCCGQLLARTAEKFSSNRLPGDRYLACCHLLFIAGCLLYDCRGKRRARTHARRKASMGLWMARM